MRKKKFHGWIFSLVLVINFFIFSSDLQGQSSFTQQDRDMLIEVKITLKEMDKRISELREDMNKRFEQVDKRIEQVDKRIDDSISFMWILASIFAGMFVLTIGFALWDRRTMIRPFETKFTEMDKKNEEKYCNLISALREYAAKDKKFAAAMERFNIL